MRILVWVAAVFRLAGTNAQATEYNRIQQAMNQLATDYPEWVTPFDLGENDQGQMIQGLIIGDAGKTDGISHLVVGTHHGNEQLSADLAMQFAEDVVAQFLGGPTRLTDALASNVFHVIPVLNIGGFNSNYRREYSADGVSHDPNRDYPDPCVRKDDFKLQSTALLADYVRASDFVAAITIHGYIGTFTYPWGIYTNRTATPDHETYVPLGNLATPINGYRSGTHADVIYPAAGAFEDWAYHELGIWTMLVELARRPDLAKDSQMMLEYFASVPSVRSDFHEHLGDCTQTFDMGFGRP